MKHELGTKFSKQQIQPMNVAWIVAKYMQMYAELIRQLHLVMGILFQWSIDKTVTYAYPFYKMPKHLGQVISLPKDRRLLIWEHPSATNRPFVATVPLYFVWIDFH